MTVSDQTATFTIQDLTPDVAKVFEAARRFGSARVRTSGGETFEVVGKPPTQQTVEEVLARYDAHCERLRQMGLRQPTDEENERINQIISGEI